MPIALPDIGLLAAAIFLLLIAAALWVLIQLIQGSIGKAPVIGSWITTNVGGWLNDARNAILRAQSATWHALVQLTDWASNLLFSWFVNISLGLENAAQATERLVLVRLPLLATDAYSRALSLAMSAENYAQGLYLRLLLDIDQLASQANAAINSAFIQALSYASNLVSAARAEAVALVSRAEADAANLVIDASTQLRAEIASAEALAAREVSTLAASTQAAVNQLASDMAADLQTAETMALSQVQALQRGIVTDLETIGDSAVGLAWPDAVPDLQALRGVLGADFPWLNDLAGLMAGAGTAGLLGALIRSMATSQALTRLATDCIVPQCRNLSGLGNDLSQLSALFAEGTLFAWLAEGATNPAGWAADTKAVLDPVGQATIATARGVFGGK